MAVSERSCRNERKNLYGATILCTVVLATLLVIGVKLNPGLVEIIVQAFCSGCDRNLVEHNMNRVAAAIIPAVEMLSFKVQKVENGTGTDVHLRVKRN